MRSPHAETTLVPGELINSIGQCVPADEFGRCADFDPLKQVYWGDTHAHTELSFDANMQGTRTTQDDAYAFARGEAIPLQPYDENDAPTRMAQIDRPLDFVMLSDHAEFLGTLVVCNDPESPGYESRQCVDYRAAQEFDADPREVIFIFIEINGLLAFEPEDARYPELCGPDAELCLDAGMDVWRDIVDKAEANYDSTRCCEFTTFPGYEWSGVPLTRNMHRNVMFKNGNVTQQPYGYFDEPYPKGLWDRLEEECLNAGNGCDVLTIPHNTNLSDGIEFDGDIAYGAPFTSDYVEQRNLMEPVIEIYQHKGASECLPGEPASDEQCGFELLPYRNLGGSEPGHPRASQSQELSPLRIWRGDEIRERPRNQSLRVRDYRGERHTHFGAGFRCGGRFQGSCRVGTAQPLPAAPRRLS